MSPVNIHFTFKVAINNLSINYRSRYGIKCSYILFFIFNGLHIIENGVTSLYRGTSKLIKDLDIFDIHESFFIFTFGRSRLE